MLTTDKHPITIDQIFDIERGCDPDLHCLFVTSTIPIVLKYKDNPALVNDAIVNGMIDNFQDGSFLAALPEDAAACF